MVETLPGHLTTNNNTNKYRLFLTGTTKGSMPKFRNRKGRH